MNRRFVKSQTTYLFDIDEIHKKFQEGDAVFVVHHSRGWSRVCFILNIQNEYILVSYFSTTTYDYIEVEISPEDLNSDKVELFIIPRPDNSEKAQSTIKKLSPNRINDVIIHKYEEFYNKDYNPDEVCIFISEIDNTNIVDGCVAQVRLFNEHDPKTYALISGEIFLVKKITPVIYEPMLSVCADLNKSYNVAYVTFKIEKGTASSRIENDIRNGVYNKAVVLL